LEFERTERKFSAAEVADFFGVPEVTQRDWRRRETNGDWETSGKPVFRPAHRGKKFQFTLNEACALAIAKIMIDNGKPVGAALWVARMYAPLAVLQIELCQVGVHFEGIDPNPTDTRSLIYQLNGVPDTEVISERSPTRFLFFPAPKVSKDADLLAHGISNPEKQATAQCFASLSEMESNVTGGWAYGSIMDLVGFAMGLSIGLQKPIITYRLVEDGE